MSLQRWEGSVLQSQRDGEALPAGWCAPQGGTIGRQSASICWEEEEEGSIGVKAP